jgi:hypothetical protein
MSNRVVGAIVAYIAIAVSVVAVGGYFINKNALDNFEDEALARVDQTCRLFEADHFEDVEGLRSTYTFLNNVRGTREAETALVQFVVRTLPRVESEARVDAAPPYCDEEDVGLPEPDPELPQKQDFSDLLVTSTGK